MRSFFTDRKSEPLLRPDAKDHSKNDIKKDSSKSSVVKKNNNSNQESSNGLVVLDELYSSAGAASSTAAASPLGLYCSIMALGNNSKYWRPPKCSFSLIFLLGALLLLLIHYSIFIDFCWSPRALLYYKAKSRFKKDPRENITVYFSKQFWPNVLFFLIFGIKL